MENTLKGKKILITAGPTREYLDPVRFITNESSGKMGYAIAEELYRQGAELILVSGPVNVKTTIPSQYIKKVTSALEMFDECKKHFKEIDIAIFTAAVADYRPKYQSDSKIKKSEDITVVEFVKNPDIAAEFGKIKTNQQISLGFALETNDVFENAANKLKTKGFDTIVINSPKPDEGFGYDTNKVSILRKDGTLNHYPLKTKQEVAKDIVTVLISIY
jgi:phosphopantothenoylcysteine decarboxylase/phosphopantothenate--cysteine ligase